MSQVPQLDAPSEGPDPRFGSSSESAVGKSTSVPVEHGPTSSNALAPRTKKKSRIYQVVSFLLTAGLLGIGYWTRERWEPSLEAWIRPAAGEQGRKPRSPSVPFAIAAKESVSQYINCLGTVTAFQSVVIRSRVDGELIEVAFQEGQMVEAGQLLARIDPRAFEASRDQAQGQLQRDLAALELARLNYERSKNVKSETTLSQQERDEFAAMYKQAQALVEVDRAAVANTELQITYSNIVAPIGGRVGLRLVDQGNVIKSSDANGLAVITQLKPISILFPIPQDEIPRVQRQVTSGNPVPVFAYDRSFQNLLAEGTLTAVDNQVDATTGTLRLKATFENTDENLFPNQFVNVRLLVKQWNDSIVIPSSAVQRGADFLYVYVVGEDSTVDVARVTVAFSEAGRSVIESGLVEGQRVVTEGTDKLQPKTQVTLQGAPKEAGNRDAAQPTSKETPVKGSADKTTEPSSDKTTEPSSNKANEPGKGRPGASVAPLDPTRTRASMPAEAIPTATLERHRGVQPAAARMA
jgi:membrane fusion protein, multidrug efflux system